MGLYEGPVSAAARLLLAAIFVWAGIHKILNPEGTMAYMTAYGLTVATMILYLCASLIEIGGGVALALGFMTREAAIMLVAFMIIVTAIFHARVGDPNQLTHFLKNTAMTGALLYVWAYGAGPWGRDEETAPDRNVGVTPELQGALALLGRMLLALIFVVSAVKSLMNPDAAQKYAAAMGLTGGTGVIVAVGILAEIGGAVLLVVGQWVRVGAAALMVVLVAATITFRLTSMSFVIDAAIQDQQFHLMKNFAILGGLLYVWVYGAGRLSVEGAVAAKRAA